MKKKCLKFKTVLFVFSFMFFFLATLLSLKTNASAICTGKYSCFMFNVGGVGGDCTYSPELVINPNGTYTYDTSNGTWKVENGKLYLSNAKLWGAGTIESNNRVVFNYQYKGLKQVVTYLNQYCSANSNGSVSSVGGAEKTMSTRNESSANEAVSSGNTATGGKGKYVPTVSIKTISYNNMNYTIFDGVDKIGQKMSVLAGANGVVILSVNRMKNQVKTQNGYINKYYKKPLYQIYFYPDAAAKTLAFRLLKDGSGLSYYDVGGKIIIYRYKNGSSIGGALNNSEIQNFGISMASASQFPGGGVSKIVYVKLKGGRYLYVFEAVNGLIYFVTDGKKIANNPSTILFGIIKKIGGKSEPFNIFEASPLKNGNFIVGIFRHRGGIHKLYFQFDNLRHRLEFGTLHPQKNLYYVSIP